MKTHIFITGFRNGTLDLDKKLPNLIKTYPDGKIEKTTQYNICQSSLTIYLYIVFDGN